jgi:hypothetical protein
MLQWQTAVKRRYIAENLMHFTLKPRMDSCNVKTKEVCIKTGWNQLVISAVWSSYERTWFSGLDKQEIFIFILFSAERSHECPTLSSSAGQGKARQGKARQGKANFNISVNNKEILLTVDKVCTSFSRHSLN